MSFNAPRSPEKNGNVNYKRSPLQNEWNFDSPPESRQPSPLDAMEEEDKQSELDCALSTDASKECTRTIPDAFDSILKCRIFALPPEMTSEVFIRCLPTQRMPNPNDAPLLFTRICRVWRIIAISTPELWDSASMGPARQDDSSMNTYIDMLNMWFSRAAERPLYFQMPLANHRKFSMLTESRQSLLDLIERYSRQWQTLILTISPASFPSTICFPQLEKLQIPVQLSPTVTCITAWKNTPSLRNVDLFALTPATIVLPWRQLTNIKCTALTVLECLDIFREASSLLDCKLRGVKATWSSPVNSSSISLPLLRSLELMLDSFDVLPHITLPLLRILNLSNAWFKRDSVSAVLDLLSRSRCQLTELVLGRDSDHLPTLLNELPSLTSLRMENTTSEPVALIFRRLSDTSFLPQLENFSVVHCDLEEITRATDIDIPNPAQVMFADLANGLAIRWNQCSRRLTSFALQSSDEFSEPLQPNVVHRLKTLSAEGMDIYIQVGDRSWI
ncbi:hypothetical protein C8J57DRAFT_299211 [Mycena rebaudengoi]|nr:hypothetical protein C8J57DRAFT_299211 [Mycena rebaudengoi]